MIFGTWHKQDTEWLVRIPKDKFWGQNVPQKDDEVTVIKKGGSHKVVQIDCLVFLSEANWYFDVFDEEPDQDPLNGADHWDYF